MMLMMMMMMMMMMIVVMVNIPSLLFELLQLNSHVFTSRLRSYILLHHVGALSDG